MKKSSIPSILVSTLTVLSFGCYVYLHQVAFDVTGHCPSSSHAVVSEDSEANSSKLLLPDIALVKGVLSLSKLILNEAN